MTTPLIYTSEGNIPEADLIFEVEWDMTGLSAKLFPDIDSETGQLKFQSKLEGYIVCKPTYYIKEFDSEGKEKKGKLVKQSAYVYHTGIEAKKEQGRLGS